MRENGIAGVTRRRRRNLTSPDAGAAMVPDLIRRGFTVPMPGLKLIGDISCFATGEGWLYLATVVDLCSKEMIGYALAPHMRADLAVDAITAAYRTGLVAGNAIMHTDRGSQAIPRESLSERAATIWHPAKHQPHRILPRRRGRRVVLCDNQG
jgi:transposase InsO family protein